MTKNRIKDLRLQKGLSQSELAKKVGISNQIISFYENNKREPKIENWQKLADFFGVSVPYLQGISNIKDLDRMENLEKLIAGLEKTSDGKQAGIPFNEAVSFAINRQIKEFSMINNAILNERNDHLSPDKIKKYRKIVASFDNENLSDMDEINLYITSMYLLMLSKINGDKKD